MTSSPDPDLTTSEQLDEDELGVDPLEGGVEPPEDWSGADRFGTTPREQRAGETLDERLAGEGAGPDGKPGGGGAAPVRQPGGASDAREAARPHGRVPGHRRRRAGGAARADGGRGAGR